MLFRSQAEAEVEALEVNLKDLPTKDDLTRETGLLRRDLKELDTSLKHDMKELESRLKHENELMRLEMRDIERRMTIKLGGLMVVAVGAVATLVKLL